MDEDNLIDKQLPMQVSGMQELKEVIKCAGVAAMKCAATSTAALQAFVHALTRSLPHLAMRLAGSGPRAAWTAVLFSHAAVDSQNDTALHRHAAPDESSRTILVAADCYTHGRGKRSLITELLRAVKDYSSQNRWQDAHLRGLE